MAILMCFLVFAIVFCHYMNKWSRELDELELSPDQPDNLVVANFAPRAEQKRAA
jgi:hypothetical protein